MLSDMGKDNRSLRKQCSVHSSTFSIVIYPTGQNESYEDTTFTKKKRLWSSSGLSLN